MTRLAEERETFKSLCLWDFLGGAFRVNKQLRAHLPPVEILPVDNLQDVAFLERYPSLSTWDQVVVGRVVVKVRPHVHLRDTHAQVKP